MIDLRELMDDRSAAHHAPAAERLSAVQRKVRIRRRRLTAAGVALIAAVGLVGYLVVPGRNLTQSPLGDASPIASVAPPTPNPKPIAGGKIGPFDEYSGGYRVVAFGQAPMSSKKLQFTWTIGTLDTTFYSYCPGLPSNATWLDEQYAINGTSVNSLNCVSDLSQPQPPHPTFKLPAGIGVGDTVTVTLTVTGAQDGMGHKLSTVPTVGTIFFAVAEKVPFDEFPRPPRPTNLQPPHVDDMASEPGTKIVLSDPADPNKTVTTTLTWHQSYDITLIAQTPGIYSVAVNGVEVLTRQVFNYADHEGIGCVAGQFHTGFCKSGLAADGETVTVTITAQYATGPWLVELRS